MTELFNRLVNLDVAASYAAVAAVLPGQTGLYSGSLPDSLIRPDRNNFAPRLGFAWRPLTKGSLVIRGGYGVYYNTSVYNLVASNLAQQPPFAQSLSNQEVAAVVTYIRMSWGNHGTPVSPQQVSELRSAPLD